METMSYVLPGDVDQRPISVIGGGTLGRRIAMMFSAGGSRVQLFSRSADSREAAKRFVDEQGTRRISYPTASTTWTCSAASLSMLREPGGRKAQIADQELELRFGIN
jgi:threonine dehydrogenase-like Zn-dependent dehydrogenase